MGSLNGLLHGVARRQARGRGDIFAASYTAWPRSATSTQPAMRQDLSFWRCSRYTASQAPPSPSVMCTGCTTSRASSRGFWNVTDAGPLELIAGDGDSETERRLGPPPKLRMRFRFAGDDDLVLDEVFRLSRVPKRQ